MGQWFLTDEKWGTKMKWPYKSGAPTHKEQEIKDDFNCILYFSDIFLPCSSVEDSNICNDAAIIDDDSAATAASPWLTMLSLI